MDLPNGKFFGVFFVLFFWFGFFPLTRYLIHPICPSFFFLAISFRGMSPPIIIISPILPSRQSLSCSSFWPPPSIYTPRTDNSARITSIAAAGVTSLSDQSAHFVHDTGDLYQIEDSPVRCINCCAVSYIFQN